MRKEDISLQEIDRLIEVLLVYLEWSGRETSLAALAEELANHATSNDVPMTELVAFRYVRSYARRNHLRIAGSFEHMRLIAPTYWALDGSMQVNREPTFAIDPESEEPAPATDPDEPLI